METTNIIKYKENSKNYQSEWVNEAFKEKTVVNEAFKEKTVKVKDNVLSILDLDSLNTNISFWDFTDTTDTELQLVNQFKKRWYEISPSAELMGTVSYLIGNKSQNKTKVLEPANDTISTHFWAPNRTVPLWWLTFAEAA
jgi:hypothetical protein